MNKPCRASMESGFGGRSQGAEGEHDTRRDRASMESGFGGRSQAAPLRLRLPLEEIASMESGFGGRSQHRVHVGATERSRASMESGFGGRSQGSRFLGPVTCENTVLRERWLWGWGTRGVPWCLGGGLMGVDLRASGARGWWHDLSARVRRSWVTRPEISGQLSYG